MRNVLLTLLLASAAASPALAQDYHQDPRQARAERQQARSDRQAAREDSRSEARPSRPAQSDFARPSNDFSRPSRPADFARPSGGDYQPRPSNNFVRQQQAPNGYAGADYRAQQRYQARDNRFVEQQAQRQDMRQQRQDYRQQRQDYRQQQQDFRQQARTDRRPPIVSRTPQPNTQPPMPTTTRSYRPAQSWSTMWRTSPQYDWRNYRDRHRSQFHLGFYYDPFGWGYQRYDIGWRMWPSYYGNQFWINDPWDYRLPYAPPGTRWIRYYDDALLVDTWSGEVVDVLYDFFW